VPQYEALGIVFKDDGKSKPALQIFRDHGANCVRLRLFVNPNGRGEAVNDLPYTIALAKRAKALGFLILLDLHYSDTWADPGHQIIPAAWKDLALPELMNQVRDYTAQVVKALADAGAAPDMVQIGNEINRGLLRPLGGFDDKTAPESVAFDHIADLLKAGAQGVHQALGDPCPARVIVHLANAERTEGIKKILDNLTQRQVPFDMVGLSYYPALGGTLSRVTATLNLIAATYKKPISIVETAYPWRPSEARSKVPSMVWPQTPEGQKQYLLDLAKTLRAVPNGLGAGFFYWHPDSVPAGSLPLWQQGDMALFDDSDNALVAISAFQRP
jgi:arabinogalactan endo-1,4-beta-galactosidase